MVPAAPSLAAVVHTVKAASALTEGSGTARVETTIKASFKGTSLNSTVTETADGVTDFRHRLADLVSEKGPAAGMEIRLVDGMSYEKLPVVLQNLRHAQTPWISSPAPPSAGGASPGTSPTGDPDATITQLENMPLSAITAAQRVGSASVRGVETTEYRLSLNLVELNLFGALAQAKAGTTNLSSTHIRSADMEIWVDRSGLIRRQRMTEVLTAVVGAISVTGTTDITTDLYDFGVAVHISPPPADQVTPASSLGLATYSAG